MNMTNDEIVRDYAQARNKSRQIKILADLNGVPPSEIRAILADASVEGVEPPKRVRRADRPAVAPEQEAEDAPVPSVYDLAESVLTAMSAPHVSEDVRRIAADLLSALFRDYLTDRLRLPEAVQGKEVQNHE